MNKIQKQVWALLIVVLGLTSLSTAQNLPFTLKKVGTYHTGLFDESAAEISAFDPASKRLFVINANDNTLDILDLSDPKNPTLVSSVDFDSYGGAINSVAVHSGIVAVAVEADVKQDAGQIIFFDTNGSEIQGAATTVGALPDMVTFNKAGTRVLVANEGEPNDDYSVDPVGSISVLDVTINSGIITVNSNTTIGFEDFNAGGSRANELPADVNIYGPNASVAQDLEPEYVAVSPDDSKAFVSLQENNAVAIIDLSDNSIIKIAALGFKDHMAANLGLDASDRDDMINIANWPVKGMYQPDALAAYEAGGMTYFITANEGDAREYITDEVDEAGCDLLNGEWDDDECIVFAEESRIKDLDLDATAFSNAEDLQENEQIGRLNVTTTLGDTDNDGEYEELYSFGARSFTIWDADGNIVWDSGDALERITADLLPRDFNANNDENDSFESRSDNKGPEPEGVTVATINDSVYAFIGLERVGGVAVYNVTTPSAPMFVEYVNNRNFGYIFDPDEVTPQDLMEVGDLGPEGLTFIGRSDSPNGGNLLVVTNEVSGSTTIFELVTPIADVKPLDNNVLVTVEGVVTRARGDHLYLQDETGALSTFDRSTLVRDSVDSGYLRSGDRIRLIGETAFFNGQEQMDNFTSFEILERNVVVEPQTITLAQLAADGEAYESRLVRVNNVEFIGDADTVTIFGSSTNYDIQDGSGTFDNVVMRMDSGTRSEDTNDQVLFGTPAPQGKFDFVGVIVEFSGTYQLTPIEVTDVKESSYKLTILHNNDGESALLNAGSGLDDIGGVARFKSLVDSMKAKSTVRGSNPIMLSSGDNFLPGPEFDASLENGTFYDALAINAIGYDAMAIGNHDFDFGPEVLADFIEATTDLPFVTSNLGFSGEADLQALYGTRIVNSTVLSVNGQQVGIVGATTPELRSISSPRNVDVAQAVADSVQKYVDIMKGNGVNKIILISHLQSVEEDAELASMLTDIDVMIAGGGDELLAKPGTENLGEDVFGSYPLVYKNANDKDVYVVTTPGEYRYLGQLEIEFDMDGNVTGVDQSLSNTYLVKDESIGGVPKNADLVTTIETPVTNHIAGLASEIIGTSAVGLDGVRGNIRSQETNLGNLITDAFRWQAEQLSSNFGVKVPEVALANGGGIRNNNVIPAGNISKLNTFEILPFSNFLTVIEDVTADELKLLLENAVSRIESGSGRFAQVSGLNIEYTLRSRPMEIDRELGEIVFEGSRIINVALEDGTVIVENGYVVEGAPSVSIATVDFLARGGDDYPFNPERRAVSLGVSYQQTLSNYIVDGLSGNISAEDYPEGGEGRVKDMSDVYASSVLTVLHNNDGESQLINAGSGKEDFGGIARFASLVDTLRNNALAHNSDVLMLSSGDNFLAGAEFNASLDRGDNRFYDAIALDRIGYDAIAIGNHDFDFGPDVLADFINTFDNDITFLSSNLVIPAETKLGDAAEAGKIASAIIVEQNGVQYGVIGATTTELDNISSPGYVEVEFNVAEQVQAVVDQLEEEGVNKIILISHLQSVSEDSLLAAELDGVDIMIAGGGDELFANPGDRLIPGDEEFVKGEYPQVYPNKNGDDVYVVTTPGNYGYLGQLVVEFDAAGNVVMINENSGMNRVSGIEEDAVDENPGIKTDVVDPVVEYLADLASTVIATSEVDLDGRRSNIRSVETNVGNLVSDAFRWQANELAANYGVTEADVALANGGGIRNDAIIEAGELTILDTFDILPFTNFLVMVEDVSPERFKSLLEQAVSAVEFGAGRFAQVSGFSYEYDTDEEARDVDDETGELIAEGSRVINVTLDDGTKIVENGEIVADAPSINIATVNFLAAGGDGYPYDQEAGFTSLGATYQQVLQNYLVDGLGGEVTAEDYPEGGEGRITDITGSSNENSMLPAEFALNQNYPNPFNPSTKIQFALPQAAQGVRLEVYDVLGRKVATLLNKDMAAGFHTVEFNASRLSSGMYFYRIQAGNNVSVKKMMLIK